MTVSQSKAGATISGPSLGPDPNPSFKAEFPDKLAVEHPFAYAIVESSPAKWSAVLLEGVSARTVTCLEPNGQPENQGRAMGRIVHAIQKRTIARKWGKP